LRKYRSYLSIVTLLFLLSCAQQSSPSGGAKDIEPPKVVQSVPANFSLNYLGNSIELKFDEYVQINNLKEQLLVTPSLKFPLEFQLVGKTLKITFVDSLKPNTTYQFNFGEGIKDITESNPLDSNLFLFSTGNYIDSLNIKGKLKDAFTLAPLENTLVMLYEDIVDSIPFNERPTYVSKTDKSGFFDISYLPRGEFKLIAVKDENANYLFDPLSELVGFTDELVSANDTNQSVIHLFNEKHANQYVKSASSPKFGKVMFEFNDPTVNPSAKLIGQSFKKQWYIADLNQTKDTLVYWITEAVDTLQFQVSDEDKIIDTVDVIMRSKPKEKKWSSQKLKIKINGKSSGIMNLFAPLVFSSQHPVTGYDEKMILLVENEKDTISVKLKSEDKALRNYFFEYEWKEDASYSLSILPGAFLDCFGLQNDTIQAKFSTPTWNKYADVNLSVELPKSCKSGLIQLLTQQQEVLQENSLSMNGIIIYKHLQPGKYLVKMVYDENENGKWDTGNLLQKQQPEKVIYYSGSIEVRSGWDADLIWEIKD